MEIPEKWEPKFYLIFQDEKENSVELSEKEANSIKASIKRGSKYIELGVSLIPVSAIKMVKARYNYDNIPPRPLPTVWIEKGKEKRVESEELETWEALFGNKKQVVLKKNIY